ncbi:MAG: HD domain-containing protein [Chitinivibrionales bacterium]|nr:HD domain-containing protein [Chitinivibrionales bacterium]MBD3395489.1 HD domain-containing protein [Chitinivibrionales bacterium]
MNGKVQTALRIVEILVENGYQAVFAGGYVRDMLLGCEYAGDIDIATSAAPQAVASLFPRVTGVGEHFGVMLVIEGGVPFEVATFRSDVGVLDGRHPREVTFSSPEMDARRRDFTINGLFYDPLKNEVLDYVEGRRDLQAGLIRAIGDPGRRFKEDYLRLLRAVRFAARFDFRIDPETWSAMHDAAAGIEKVARERILQEITKTLQGPHPARAVGLLADSGLLAVILPEVEALKGVEQPEQFHPEGDVFSHTMKALSFLKSPSAVAAWSTLLHDIGKPATMTRTDRVRFNNHHRVGARMARRVLKRLRASRALIEDVCECIDKHMDFMNVTRMRLSTLKKFLARPTLDDELELHRVDCLASHGDLENYEFVLQKRAELADEEVRPDPLLTGRDLIELGFKPGPVFGRILQAAYDLQLDENLRTPEEARAWARQNRDSFGRS